jgi:signal transduction histidine kinase
VSFGEQLIGIVSHDLRNPLNTIALTAAVMARRDTLAPKDAQFVQRIQNAAQRAGRLIRDLLDFTQVRLDGRIPVQLRPANLHELLKDVVAELDAAHPARIACSLGADDPRGEWDPDRLSQVAENLVLNALKYGAAGGTVRVSTRSDDKWVVMEVHNDGEPIPADRIAGIFEPLQRGADVSQPNPDRSIGMGLYIVKHIVQAHGGSIGVASNPGHGTTFTVTLPRRR